MGHRQCFKWCVSEFEVELKAKYSQPIQRFLFSKFK